MFEPHSPIQIAKTSAAFVVSSISTGVLGGLLPTIGFTLLFLP